MEQSNTNATSNLPATLSTRNDQHSGSGPGEVEKEIRLLDSSAPSGGQGDSEGQVGCADDIPGSGQLEKREHGKVGGIAPEPFFFDIGAYANWEPDGIYVRASETILGDEENVDSPTPDSGPSCFNCGQPNHIVTACPHPVNRELVALSRQFHTFLKAARGAVDFKRIHEVEAWRQQRLEWLDIFEPGEIRGPLLRDALGGNDGDWLANMALWGYPKGWVNVQDPREKVRQMIWDENCDGEDDEPHPFFIFCDGDDGETVHLDGKFESLNADEGEDDSQESNDDSDDTSTALSNLSSSIPTQPVRWATYPPSHFSSQLLHVYNGFTLPPIADYQGSATYTTDRRELWQRIIAEPLPSSRWTSSNPPPPPTTAPPPLPPPPHLEPPPPLPAALPPEEPSLPGPKLAPPLLTHDPEDDEEADMDISD